MNDSMVGIMLDNNRLVGSPGITGNVPAELCDPLLVSSPTLNRTFDRDRVSCGCGELCSLRFVLFFERRQRCPAKGRRSNSASAVSTCTVWIVPRALLLSRREATIHQDDVPTFVT